VAGHQLMTSTQQRVTETLTHAGCRSVRATVRRRGPVVGPVRCERLVCRLEIASSPTARGRSLSLSRDATWRTVTITCGRLLRPTLAGREHVQPPQPLHGRRTSEIVTASHDHRRTRGRGHARSSRST